MVISFPNTIVKGVEPALAGSVPMRDTDRNAGITRARRHVIIFVALLLLSAPLRLVNLQAPFVGEHEFRQTQTALSVWEIRAHGFSPLHPKLPLFGPPWECPFEYPIFQIAAAALDSIAPWKNLDISIRLTNLLFFYLSTIALYFLARVLFRAKTIALFAAAVFLFSPYNVFWSRTSMIESAAAFFAVAYLVSFIRWTHKPTLTLFSLCAIFGILGCLTKITTFVIPTFVCAALTGLEIAQLIRQRLGVSESQATLQRDTGKCGNPHSRALWLRLASLMLLLILPLAVGQCYTKFGDSIKEKSPYTKWLSSSDPGIKQWAYGTLEQRMNLGKWNNIQSRIQGVVTPPFAVALAIGGCFLPFRIRGFSALPLGNFLVGLSLMLAPFASIALFFNLYFIHTYYLNACSPFLALITGAGLWMIFKPIRTNFIRILFILLLLGLWLWTSSYQLAQAAFESGRVSRVDYLDAASKVILQDQPVIILSASEWSPFASYYLKRRVFMGMRFNRSEYARELIKGSFLKRNGFHWLLIEKNSAEVAKFAQEIMAGWNTSRLMSVPAGETSYLLYSLSDE